MALTRSPVYTISIAVRDQQGKTATVQFYAGTVNTMIEVIAAIESSFAPKTQALTNGAIVGWSVSTSAQDPDVMTANIDEESNVKEKATFSFRAANGAPYVIGVPSPRGDIITPGGSSINLAHPDVAAFVAMVTDGTAFGALGTYPKTYLGSDVRSLIKAEFKTRN